MLKIKDQWFDMLSNVDKEYKKRLKQFKFFLENDWHHDVYNMFHKTVIKNV